MNNPIRIRYFFWLASLLLAFFLINSLTLLAINLPTIVSRGPDWKEEFAEWLVITTTGLAALPLALLVAWRVSRHLLTPLREMAETAHRIEAGMLAERISVPQTHDEIAELAKSLNRALDRYEAAMSQQKQFSGTASHQLRTPLATIRSLGEVALQNERAPESYRETIASMLEVSSHLEHVVEQLLMMSRLSDAELRKTFTPVSVEKLFATLLDLFGPLYQAKSIHIACRNPDAVILHAHEDLLLQALGNLLDNAIAHTPEQGRILLAATLHDPDAVALSVTDTGPGFAYPREAARPRHDPGPGLGLLIVETIIRLHHGRMQVAPASPDGGGSVALVLPLYRAAAGRGYGQLP